MPTQKKKNEPEQTDSQRKRLSLDAICRNMKITFNVNWQTNTASDRERESFPAAVFSRWHLDRPKRDPDSWRATSSILFLLHAFIFLFCVYIKVKRGRLRSSALISAPGQDSRTIGHRSCSWECTQRNLQLKIY